MLYFQPSPPLQIEILGSHLNNTMYICIGYHDLAAKSKLEDAINRMILGSTDLGSPGWGPTLLLYTDKAHKQSFH